MNAFSHRTMFLAGAAVAAPVSLWGDGTSKTPSPKCENAGPRNQELRLQLLRKYHLLADCSQVSTTTGRIKGGEKSPPLPIQGWGPGEGKDGIPSPGVLSLFVHFLFARAKRKWTLSKFVKQDNPSGLASLGHLPLHKGGMKNGQKREDWSSNTDQPLGENSYGLPQSSFITLAKVLDIVNETHS